MAVTPGLVLISPSVLTRLCKRYRVQLLCQVAVTSFGLDRTQVYTKETLFM